MGQWDILWPDTPVFAPYAFAYMPNVFVFIRLGGEFFSDSMTAHTLSLVVWTMLPLRRRAAVDTIRSTIPVILRPSVGGGTYVQSNDKVLYSKIKGRLWRALPEAMAQEETVEHGITGKIL